MSLHAVWIGILYRTEGTMVKKAIISFALFSLVAFVASVLFGTGV